MESLIKRKQKLEQELAYYKEKCNQLCLEEEGRILKIKSYKEDLEKERVLFQSLKEKRNEYKTNLITLKKEIEAYKENKLVEVRRFYLDKYKNLLKRIADLDFKFTYKIFSTFELAREIYKEIEFENLKKEFHDFLNLKKANLRTKTLESLASKLKDRKRIHEALFYLRFLVKYELFFKETVLIDFLYETTQSEFEYHFLSNKETNRLDKPEWMFDYLYSNYVEYQKIYKSYEELYARERVSHDVSLDENSIRPSFEDFVMRTKALITIKINEIVNLDSNQKRRLILNFGVHLMNFMSKVKSKFNISIELNNFSEIIDGMQLEHILERVEQVHEKRYTEWFDMYEDITRETMVYIINFKPINNHFKLINLIENIVEYNSVFICSMRYIQREEIKALCYLYTKFEKFKGFLSDTENELTQEKIFKNEGVVGDSLIDEEEMIEIFNKISEFNLENLKLLKNLIENDLGSLLHSLKRFKYSAETITRNFIVELNRILEDYKGCEAYRSLHKLSGSLTDKYILEEILTCYKFDHNEFLDFNFFFSKLKRFYDTDTWESQEALNCIKDILEGRSREGALFVIISQLYEESSYL